MTSSNEPISKSGRLWSWAPAMLLVTMLSGLGTLAYIAIDDPHFALEPNYYDKAVHWDRAQAQARDSDALGLQVAVSSALVVATGGKLAVELSVKTRDQLALSGAEVELEAFPNAFASRVQHISLQESAPGLYRGQLSHGLRGLWELRVVVKHGGLRYGQVLRQDVTKAGAV